MTTGTDFTNVMNLSLTATQAEYILDQAINELNVEGAGLSNMAGEAGSKTVTLTSKQQGAVFAVARAVYNSYWLEIGTRSLAGVSDSAPDLRSNPVVDHMIKRYGRMLASIPFKVGEDTSGIE